MEDILRLRFQVYCHEKNYLDAVHFANGQETDDFDAVSSHFSVVGNGKDPMGCTRVIECEEMEQLPMFQNGMPLFNDFRKSPSDRVHEVSRMIVNHDYRHGIITTFDAFHKNEKLPNPPVRKPSELILYKLFRLACRRAAETHCDWFVVAIEKPFLRKLNLMGMPMKQIGPPCEYFGSVIPCAMNHEEMRAITKENFPNVWDFFWNPAEDIDTKTFLPENWDLNINFRQPARSNNVALH